MSFEKIKLTFLVLLFFFLQNHIFPYFSFMNSIPDLLAILIIYMTFYLKRSSLIVLAFFTGLLRDIFSIQFFGSETLSYLLSAYLIQLLIRKVPIDKMTFKIMMAVLFSLTSQFFHLFFVYLFDPLFNPFEVIWFEVLPILVYTSIIAPFFLILLHSFFKDSFKQYRLF